MAEIEKSSPREEHPNALFMSTLGAKLARSVQTGNEGRGRDLHNGQRQPTEADRILVSTHIGEAHRPTRGATPRVTGWPRTLARRIGLPILGGGASRSATTGTEWSAVHPLCGAVQAVACPPLEFRPPRTAMVLWRRVHHEQRARKTIADGGIEDAVHVDRHGLHPGPSRGRLLVQPGRHRTRAAALESGRSARRTPHTKILGRHRAARSVHGPARRAAAGAARRAQVRRTVSLYWSAVRPICQAAARTGSRIQPGTSSANSRRVPSRSSEPLVISSRCRWSS